MSLLDHVSQTLSYRYKFIHEIKSNIEWNHDIWTLASAIIVPSWNIIYRLIPPQYDTNEEKIRWWMNDTGLAINELWNQRHRVSRKEIIQQYGYYFSLTSTTVVVMIVARYVFKYHYSMKPIEFISYQLNKILLLMHINVDTKMILWPTQDTNRSIVAWSFGVFNFSSALFMGTCTVLTEIMFSLKYLFTETKKNHGS